MGAVSLLATCSVVPEHAASMAGDLGCRAVQHLVIVRVRIFQVTGKWEGRKLCFLWKHGTSSSSPSFKVLFQVSQRTKQPRAKERAELPPLQDAVPAPGVMESSSAAPAQGAANKDFSSLCPAYWVWALLYGIGLSCAILIFFTWRNIL